MTNLLSPIRAIRWDNRVAGASGTKGERWWIGCNSHPLGAPLEGSWRVRCAAPTHTHTYTYNIYTIYICVYVRDICSYTIFVGARLLNDSPGFCGLTVWLTSVHMCRTHALSWPSRRISKWNYELWAHGYYDGAAEGAVCETLRLTCGDLRLLLQRRETRFQNDSLMKRFSRSLGFFFSPRTFDLSITASQYFLTILQKEYTY